MDLNKRLLAKLGFIHTEIRDIVYLSQTCSEMVSERRYPMT